MEKNNLANQKQSNDIVNQGASSSNNDSAYGKDIKGQ